MSWIKIDTTLVNKPEVVKMARLLKVTRVTLLGYLVKFFCEVDGLTEDGTLPCYGAEDINDLVGMNGFAQALESAGWLEIHEEGCTIPKFERHNGTSAKKRANKASYMAQRRHHACNPEKVTEVPPREEERRVEKKERVSLSLGGANANTLAPVVSSMAPIAYEEAREVARVKGVPEAELEKWWHYNAARGWTQVKSWQDSLHMWMLRAKEMEASTLRRSEGGGGVTQMMSLPGEVV